MLGDIYLIGRFTLEPRRQLLDAGAPVDIGGKALDLLSVLAEAHGKLVTKDELMAAVWPGLTIEENAIQVHISATRKLLGEEAARLVTIRGRGYRLDADPPGRPDHAAVTLPGAVAVLPFANLTGDPAKAYLADSIAEELITTLSRAEGLKVSARTSSFAYRGRDTDVRTIARDLGVSAVIEGNVRAGGDRLRVTVQLVDAATGFQSWSRTVESMAEDLLSLLDELTAAVGDALSAKLRAETSRPNDAEAYRLYLQAKALARQMSPASVLRSIELHREAIALDPLFARPWAGLAGSLMQATATGVLPPDRNAEARARAEEAIRLDRSHAAPHAIRAMLDATAGRWIEADSGFRSAIALDEQEPTVLSGLANGLLAPCGQLVAALAAMSRAVHLAPANGNSRVTYAITAELCGDGPGARSHLEMAGLLGVPDDRPTVALLKAEFARVDGSLDEAERLVGLAMSQLLPRGAMIAEAALRVHRAIYGRDDRPLALAAMADALVEIGPDNAVWHHSSFAGRLLTWHVWLGSLDGAYAVMERILAAWTASNTFAFNSLPPIWRTDMAAFRADPRFGSVVSRLGMMPYWQRHQPPDGHAIEQGRLVSR